MLLGRQAVLRLRPGQRADLPAVGRRHGAADGRAAHAGRDLQALDRRRGRHAPTVFFGAPTGFAGMLASPQLPARAAVSLRMCSSAGEALPARPGQRFKAHFGCDIIDGIGSTEMLHIFLSNRPGRHALRHHRQAGAGLRDRAARRGRPARARRRGGRPLHPRAERRADVLGQPREDARHLPGRLDQERRQVHARRRRLLHLRGPQRRHAEGQRHLRLARSRSRPR